MSKIEGTKTLLYVDFWSSFKGGGPIKTMMVQILKDGCYELKYTFEQDKQPDFIMGSVIMFLV